MSGARQGLLVRGADVLERLASIDHIALDKTGTLTEGKPAVSSIASFKYKDSEILQIAAAVESTWCESKFLLKWEEFWLEEVLWMSPCSQENRFLYSRKKNLPSQLEQ